MNPAADCKERALLLPCEGERLLAVLAEPEVQATSDLGVVVVVGGPQYRAGSHRQFVHLARALAGAGFPVLRFDVRGMGDSTGALRGFEQLGADVRAAIDALLAARPGLRRVVLWGLCDGASAALLYLHEHADPRVHGLCLLNPWVRSEASLARTHVKHYYRQRLMQRDFWVKLLSGQVGRDALRGLARKIRQAAALGAETAPAASFTDRMAAALAGFGGPVLLVLSEQDYTAREFSERAAAEPRWQRALARRNVETRRAAAADHTFSSAAAKSALARECSDWLARRLVHTQDSAAPGRA